MTPIISETINYVKTVLANAESGHDWWHIRRVWNMSKHIASQELNPNLLVVELAALLHDIADSKFHNGDDELGPAKAKDFLKTQGVHTSVIEHVVNIIRYMSYSSSLAGNDFESLELHIVRDADRLDAIGAIGIARAFNYGGYKNRVIYDPAIPPETLLNKETYRKSTAPTINHFYEKLLLLKDLMHTKTGKNFAQKRHDFMLQYLEHFYEEWDGKQ